MSEQNKKTSAGTEGDFKKNEKSDKDIALIVADMMFNVLDRKTNDLLQANKGFRILHTLEIIMLLIILFR